MAEKLDNKKDKIEIVFKCSLHAYLKGSMWNINEIIKCEYFVTLGLQMIQISFKCEE